MNLSHRESVALSKMDAELSGDPVLRAVAALFAQPPSGHRPQPPAEVPRRSLLARIPYPYAILSVVGVVLGLLCCGVTASVHLPDAATAGAALAMCAGMVFVVVVICRRSRSTTATPVPL